MAEKHVPLPSLDTPRAREELDERLDQITRLLEDSNMRPRGFSLFSEALAADEITLNIPAGAGAISSQHGLEDRNGRRLTPNRFIVTWQDVAVSLQATGKWNNERVTFAYYAAAAAEVKVLLMRKD